MTNLPAGIDGKYGHPIGVVINGIDYQVPLGRVKWEK